MKVGISILAVWAMLVGFVAAAEPPPPDYAKFEVLKELGVRPGGRGVAFSPDGKTLITSGTQVNIWDLETRTLIRSLRQPEGQSEGLYYPVMTPDGKQVLALMGSDWKVLVWDVQSGKLQQQITTEGRNLTLAPNGTVFASGDSIWDLKTGRSIAKLKRAADDFSADQPEARAFSRDSAICYGIGDRNYFAQWDASTGRPLRGASLHLANQYAMGIAPRGERCAIFAGVDTLKVFDSAGKELQQTAYQSKDMNPITGLTFSPDGKTLAAWSGSVLLFDVGTGALLRHFKNPGYYRFGGLAFSPDSKWLAAVDGENAMAIIWDAENGKKVAEFATHGNRASSLAFAPDSKTFLSSSPIVQWDLAAGNVRTVFWDEATVDPVRGAASLCIAPDGQDFFSCDGSFKACFWDMASGRIVKTYQPFAKPGRMSGMLSPDGRTVALSGVAHPDGEGTFFLERDTGKAIRSWPKGEGCFLAYAPDGKFYAVSRRAKPGSLDRVIFVCDAESGKETKVLPTGEVRGAVFHPSGKLLLTTKNLLDPPVLWDLGSEKPIKAPELMKCRITATAFSPDGKVLAVGDGLGRIRGAPEDSRIILWDWAKDTPLKTISSSDKCAFLGATSLAFSPDGRTLIAAADGRILVLGEKPEGK